MKLKKQYSYNIKKCGNQKSEMKEAAGGGWRIADSAVLVYILVSISGYEYMYM